MVHTRRHLGVALRRGERGEGKFKAIFITALLVFLIFAAFKTVPAYVAEYELNDKIQEMARFAQVNNYSEDQVRDQVYKVVEDLEIPVKKEEIKVTASRAYVKISLDYRIPVNLLVYQTELHFTPTAENKSIF